MVVRVPIQWLNTALRCSSILYCCAKILNMTLLNGITGMCTPINFVNTIAVFYAIHVNAIKCKYLRLCMYLYLYLQIIM